MQNLVVKSKLAPNQEMAGMILMSKSKPLAPKLQHKKVASGTQKPPASSLQYWLQEYQFWIAK